MADKYSAPALGGQGLPHSVCVESNFVDGALDQAAGEWLRAGVVEVIGGHVQESGQIVHLAVGHVPYGAEIDSQRETGLRSKSIEIVNDASEHISTANWTVTRT